MTSNRKAIVWLDVENLLFSSCPVTRSMRFPFNITQLEIALRRVENVAAIHAYGDFKLLKRIYRCNVKKAFHSLGVITHQQDCLHGKNSADMAIASAIHIALTEKPEMTTVVIGSGDRDFRPVAEYVQKLGKQLILIAPCDGLNRQLRAMADQVIHIGGNSPAVVKYANGYPYRQGVSDTTYNSSAMPPRV